MGNGPDEGGPGSRHRAGAGRLSARATGAPGTASLDPRLVKVLESAAQLQRLVPDAVLVGGSAAALYAAHRASFDHDHVLADLRERFEMVLEALEAQDSWVTNRVTAGKVILGRLGDIEAGVRQLIRTTPLETHSVDLPSGDSLVVPTPEETLRVKAFLVVKRNQVRDYLDVAGLAARYGEESCARVLADIDRFYADHTKDGVPVATQVARQLGNPRPADTRTLERLHQYKALDPHWHDWRNVVKTCRAVAAHMLDDEEGEGRGTDVPQPDGLP